MEEVKNDLIIEDVEIVEHVVEETSYTDEEIDAMCKQLKEALVQNNYETNTAILELASTIARNSKDYLDNDTYLWTMYTYALKYKELQNVNAERFCYIRMQSVFDAMRKKRPQQKALTFVKSDISDMVVAKVYAETQFMNVEIKSLKKQFLKLDVGMGAVFFFVLMVIFKFSLLTSAIMIGLVLFMNYKMSYNSLVSRYVNEQTAACKNYCPDEEIIKFDLPVYNS